MAKQSRREEPGAVAVFKASDGTEHATKEGAERRSRVVAAVEAFGQAADELRNSLAGELLTADGQPFEFHRVMNDHWKIWRTHGSMPRLERIQFYSYSATISIDRHAEQPRLRVCEVLDPTDRSRERPARWFEVADLYADEVKAREALIKACEEWLAGEHRQLEFVRNYRGLGR